MTPNAPSAKPSFTLRAATREDVPALLALIDALAEFEKLTPPDAAARERFAEHGFGPRPKFEAWLAFADGVETPVGYALFFETYSTFRASPTLYLEDLFVLPAYQGRGIGKALLRHCIRLACERGCQRMEWTVLDWNKNAQDFYQRLGARHLAEWQIYRLTGDTMAAAISEASPR